MSRFTPLTILAAAGALALGAAQTQAQVRISQVYGAGGLNAGQPNADYVELYNAGAAPVDVSGWALQFSSVRSDNILSTGWFWTRVDIPSGVIAPGGYFLVQVYSPASAVGTALPTPDSVAVNASDLVIEPGGTMVALQSFAYDMPAFFCPFGIDGALADLVSFGNVFPGCAEGSAVGPATAFSAPFQAVLRRGGGCQDTDNNAADFYAGAPAPRNSASSAPAPLYFSTPMLSSTSVNAGASTTLTAAVGSCAGGPSPEFTSVTADLTAFGLGAAVPLVGGPTVWSYGLTVPGTQTPGVYTIAISGSDGVTNYSDSIRLTVISGLPTNDLCQNATILNAAAFPTSISVITSGATADVDPGTCNTSAVGNFGIWYVFVPPTNGTLRFERNLTTSSQFFRCGIFELNAPGPNPVSDCATFTGTNSLACAVGNTWGVQTVAGRTYYILVSDNSATAPTTPATGTFSFIDTSGAPANDNCPGVIDVTTMLDTPVVVNITGATTDVIPTNGSNPLCIPQIGAQGAWYKFTATQTGSLSMNYWPGTISTGTGIKWAVWARPDTEPTATACANVLASVNPDFCSSFASLNVTTSAGMTYYILCYNGNNGSGFDNVTQVSDIQLAFHFEAGVNPANDLCVNATDLSAATLAPLTVTCDMTISTNTGEEFVAGLSTLSCAPTTSVFGYGVWFKFTATQDGVWRYLRPAGPNTNAVIWEVPTGMADPCSSFTVNNILTCVRASYVSTSVRAGKTYYMYVYRSSTTGNTPPLVLQNEFFPAAQVPTNDRCDTAKDVATIAGTPHVVDIFKAGHDITQGCAGSDQARYGIWYKYTPAQDCVVAAIETSREDIYFSLWDGGVSPPTDCNALVVDPSAASNKMQQVGLGTPMYCMTADRLVFKALAGHTYYMQVSCTIISAYPSQQLSTLFKILPTMTNENCATASTLSGTGAFDLHNIVRYVSTSDNDIAPPESTFITMNCPTTASTFTNDSWYRWVAPASGPVSFQLRQYPKPPVGMRIAFYNAAAGGDCPTSVASGLIKCLAAGTPYPDSGSVTFSPTAGQVYYIQFSSTTGSTSEPFGWAILEINQTPAATGSCCTGTACTITSAAACGGTYGGDGTTCSPTSATIRTYSGAGGTLLDSGGVDNSSASLVTSVNVPDSFSVADVEVDVSMAHAKYGDIRITLTKGSTTLILADRGRRGFSPADATAKALIGPAAYRFSDTGTNSWFSVGNVASPAYIPTGTYKPAGAIGVGPGFKNTFNGVASAGVWTLRIEDEQSSNTGTVNAWTLRLRQAANNSNPCSATQNCCRGTTCNSVASGSCTGIVAGSSSLVVGSCGVGNAFASCCYADFNHDGVQSIDDLFLYFNAYFTGSPWANVGGDGVATPTIDDLFLYINAYFGTCS